MEESTNIDVSSRRVKRIQSNSSLNKSPLKSDEESRPVISNGTGLFKLSLQCRKYVDSLHE